MGDFGTSKPTVRRAIIKTPHLKYKKLKKTIVEQISQPTPSRFRKGPHGWVFVHKQ